MRMSLSGFWRKMKFLISLILFASAAACSIQKPFGKRILDVVHFSTTGDVMVHNTQIAAACRNSCTSYDFSPSFKSLPPYFAGKDFVIGNLETTLPGKKEDYTGYPLFGAPDALVKALKETGFNLLTTSNNHSLDKGKKALRRTLDVLDSFGIAHMGTYRDQNDYAKNRVLLIEKKGIRFGFLSYTYGTNGIPIPKDTVVNIIDQKKIEDDISQARTLGANIIIVYFHFGSEYERLPSNEQRKTVASAFKSGADIVLGGHPHVIQPYETWILTDRFGEKKKRFVMFSLGNFVSSQYWRYSNGGILFEFDILKTGEGKDFSFEVSGIKYHPLYVQKQYSPVFQYNVIPAKDYLDRKTDYRLNAEEEKKLTELYNDTLEHLGRYSYIQ